MPEIAFWKTGVIEYQLGLRSPVLQFEFDQRKNACIPIRRTPGLYDSLVLYEFNVSSRDQTTKNGKRAPGCSIDLGWHTAECCELLGI